MTRSRMLNQHKQYLDTDTWKGKREMVLLRDNYTCTICGKYGGELHVHHKSYKRHGKERITDLITVCKKCHKKFH
jgi:5-methylcytosine-specific restriction endonuclease McrA